MNRENPLFHEYDHEHGPAPLYRVSRELTNLTLMFIISSIVFFLVAGTMAILMRAIQSRAVLVGTPEQTMGLFYAAITVHGQLMFFGFASMLTVGLSYYFISKFAKRPLRSINMAILSL